MATLLRMPEIAANGTHATLAAWSKKKGEPIANGDCLAEVETDKAVVEVSADSAGVMGQLLVHAGQEVEVGTPIAVLLAEGEVDADVQTLLRSIEVPVASEARASAKTAPFAPTAEESSTSVDRLRVSPLARRLAAQRGVDLSLVQGSGPGGRIVKVDVQRARLAPPRQVAKNIAAAPTDVVLTETVLAESGFTEAPHSNMRRAIARRLSESKATIPHFYLSVNCRMERLLDLRAEINAYSIRKISVNDFVVRAVAVALREVPKVNVGWTDTAMRQFQQADVAVAVSTDTGLITPIVRAADRKTLSQISTEIAELAARARSGQLRPDEYQGGSFSVSNLGMFGVSEFAAIINPPQAAILAVGSSHQRPVVDNGKLKVGMVMTCTFSVDHRAIDGAVAAEWLAVFQRAIEAPLTMLV
jgi:pyruvate dehydrogenase E2 component (dihydrolipoamide acetyltransferase)